MRNIIIVLCILCVGFAYANDINTSEGMSITLDIVSGMASIPNPSTNTGDDSGTSGGGSIMPSFGTDPVIEFIWILPDESEEQETQLEIIPNGERNDIYACLVVSDAESRDTIADVFVDVFHPDESFKYQMHARLLNITADAAEIEACKTDALEAGLISSSDFDEINYNIFSQRNWYMYKVYLPMFYHQPAGDYLVRGYATDTTSRLSEPNDRIFRWVEGTYLELDFDAIQFGNVQPGAWKVLNGDLDMSTPSKPTLRNQGNTEVFVGLEFTEFVGEGNLPNKVVKDFDAQLRNMGTDNYLEIPGEHIEFEAGEKVWFEYPISLCRQEKIDFSIHADIGIVPDEYHGELTVYAAPNVVASPPPDSEFPMRAS